jgi:hypothetical protein
MKLITVFSSAEVKNACSCSSTPSLICRHDVYRNNFTFASIVRTLYWKKDFRYILNISVRFVVLFICQSYVLWSGFEDFLGAFAKLRKSAINFVMSVRAQGTTRLPLDGFSWNLILEDFSKIYRENSSFIKNLTRIKGTVHEDQCTFLSYLAYFFLEWEMFQMTIQRMRIACWIPKAKNTHWLFNTHCFSLQQWLHGRASMLRYTYIAHLVYF